MKKVPLLAVCALAAAFAFAESPILVSTGKAAGPADLLISKEDIRIEQGLDPGFHLYVRKKPGVGSILLTETTKDPAMKEDNYAYRASEYNAVNGDEPRMLNGAFIPKEKAIWSLIDSSPEKDPAFGEAFHIFIPYVIEYGYSWSRNGKVPVMDGTFINIRAFSLPYADYAGSFKDNPFVIEVSQAPLPGPPEGNFRKDTVEKFSDLAKKTKGRVEFSKGAEELPKKISQLLKGSGPADMVLCIDTTASMKDDIDKLKKEVYALAKGFLDSRPGSRVGLVLYKDYKESYLTKSHGFARDLAEFASWVEAIWVSGGGDIPEAVYEAIEAALKFEWKSEDRRIVLIGDAPPHPTPRGKVTESSVSALSEALGVSVDVIILPQ
jgi:hypothetical protein